MRLAMFEEHSRALGKIERNRDQAIGIAGLYQAASIGSISIGKRDSIIVMAATNREDPIFRGTAAPGRCPLSKLRFIPHTGANGVKNDLRSLQSIRARHLGKMYLVTDGHSNHSKISIHHLEGIAVAETLRKFIVSE